jgi:hypothetical protein
MQNTPTHGHTFFISWKKYIIIVYSIAGQKQATTINYKEIIIS